MAKGQKRSNREIRKPKQQKTAQAPETGFNSRNKLAAIAAVTNARKKP